VSYLPVYLHASGAFSSPVFLVAVLLIVILLIYVSGLRI
jgi:hypothetical protein